jgi:hypothetical protein
MRYLIQLLNHRTKERDMEMPRIEFVVRDFTSFESAGEIAEALNLELPHLKFSATYLNVWDVHLLIDGSIVVQQNCSHEHPWGRCCVNLNTKSVSRSTLCSLLTRAERAGWDVIVGGVRLIEYPEMVWRRLALWTQFPKYNVEKHYHLIKK